MMCAIASSARWKRLCRQRGALRAAMAAWCCSHLPAQASTSSGASMSAAVAERIGQSRDLLILKQVAFLALAGAIVVATSLLSPRSVRRLALIGCGIALLMTAMTLVVGVEIKGARRWIALPGLSVQPSEFLKPCFAVVTAWLI